MARRGRPPREDGRKGYLVLIAATDQERQKIINRLTTDQRRIAQLRYIEELERREPLPELE